MDFSRLFDDVCFYILLSFDFVTYFSLLWGAFYILDEAVSGLLLRDARYQAAGWRFALKLAACVASFYSAPAVWCKNLIRGFFLANDQPELAGKTYFLAIITALSFLWLGYAIFQLTRYFHRRYTAAKCLRILPDMPQDAAFTRATAEMGLSQACKVWSEAEGISIFGVYNPVMLVPDSFAQRYTEEERYYLYLHELTHIIRYDALFNLLTDILEIFFWIFPPIKWEMRRQRECRELSCDAAVLKRRTVSPIHYGKLLLDEVKAANNRLLVGFSSRRYMQTKARLNVALGNTGALSAKRLCLYLVYGAFLVSQIFTPIPNMPYQRMLGVMKTDGSIHLVYLEPYGIEPQSTEQLLERVYAEYDKQEIISVRVARLILDWDGLFSGYSASSGDRTDLK